MTLERWEHGNSLEINQCYLLKTRSAWTQAEDLPELRTLANHSFFDSLLMRHELNHFRKFLLRNRDVHDLFTHPLQQVSCGTSLISSTISSMYCPPQIVR